MTAEPVPVGLRLRQPCNSRGTRQSDRAGAIVGGVHERGPARPPWPALTLLGQLAEPALSALLGLGTSASFPAGRRLMRLGEFGQTAYLLLSGCVKVLGNEGGREPLLSIRVGGDLVGEMAVLSKLPRSATVSACSAVSVKTIHGPDLLAFLANYPEAMIAVAGAISQQLRWANERRVDFASLDAKTRICRVLLTLAQAYGHDVDGGRDLGAPLTQDEIASMAGVRLATAEKALRAFANAGLLRLGYRSITVLDMARLGIAAKQYGDP
jgi:CRP/FNR family transcriptional regulator, cyclic AMP receptor protein